MRKMHIAIISGGYYGTSGIFTHVRELVSHLAKRDQQVCVLSPDVEMPRSDSSLTFIPIKDTPYIPQVVFYFKNLLRVHHLKKLDAIHCHDSIAFLPAYLLGRIFNIPVIYSFHVCIFSPGRQTLYSWRTSLVFKIFTRFTIPRADAVVCVTHKLCDWARKLGAPSDRVIHIPNPVDLSRFKPVYRSIDSQPVLLFVGRLEPDKGGLDLIRAMPYIVSECPAVKLIMVGDGSRGQEWLSLRDRLGLKQSVDFVGRVPFEELSDYYSRSHLFVVPFSKQGAGMSVAAMQALACGLPVICGNVGDMDELIQDGSNGFFVPSRNTQALGKVIVKILKDNSLYERLSINAISSVTYISWDVAMQKFVTLYRALGKDNNGSITI